MKGRRSTEGRGGAPTPAELSLVCFPTRSNLSIMPNKPICSPGHHGETTKRHHYPHHHHHHHRGGKASPLFWSKTKPTSDMIEPTSPKVNCAGNIKVTRAKLTNSTTTATSTSTTSSSKNWHSVMQEIERINNSKKLLKKQRRPGSVIKKDIMQFLSGGLKSLKFNLRKRFGSIVAAGSDITSSFSSAEHEDVITEVEYQEENYEHNQSGFMSARTSISAARTSYSAARNSYSAARTSVSKWFTVLHDSNNNKTNCSRSDDQFMKEDEKHEEEIEIGNGFGVDDDDDEGEELSDSSSPPPPPPNALLLMRRRSLPAKCRFAKKEEEEEEAEETELVFEEEEKNERMGLKCYPPTTTESFKVLSHSSNNFEKKSWVGGGIKDPFSRSQSWRS